MLLLSFKKFTSSIVLIGGISIAMVAIAGPLSFSPPELLSENGAASKTKLVRMVGSGWLVSAYGDAAGLNVPDVYDTKADALRPVRDVFVTVCHPANNASQCSNMLDWSAPINISNTADKFSISTNFNEHDDPDMGATPFYGDSGKPSIFVSGNFAVVTWVDKYCPGGAQRMISYTEREGITVPFSCVYVAYTNNVAGLEVEPGIWEPAVWNTLRLTDGERDAKSNFNKGLVIKEAPIWTIAWQEDPHGLQIGGAEGPGHGASGASVTHGTDIWYTYTPDLMKIAWATPVRISDNYTNDGEGGNTSPVFHPDDPDTEITVLQRGNTGAARANLMLVGGSPVPTAVIAYEESKGAERTDTGKMIRYHAFPYNTPPVSTGPYLNGEPGCVISDPLENSRRVRFVSQGNPSANGLRMGVFWRQGLPTQGGPGDIMVRIGTKTTAEGSTGLRPEDMTPAVDLNCRESDWAVVSELGNVPGSNISSNTIEWSPVDFPLPRPNELTDTTSYNPYEDARAHRAAIVGDDFYIGYSYAKDWALATYTDLDNYNFWIRHYTAAAGTWTDAANLSNILPAAKTHVKEPRLVKTPGNGMGCDTEIPANSIYSENCQNKGAFIVAWGTESNVYSHVDESVEGDIYYTRTMDKGVSFENPPVIVSGIGDNNRFESQIRPSPAGNILWSVWNEADNTFGGTHAMLSVSDESVGTAPLPPPGVATPPIPGEDPPVVSEYDVSLASFKYPENVKAGRSRNFIAIIMNNGPDVSDGGDLVIKGYVNEDDVADLILTATYEPILPGELERVLIRWIPDEVMVINWVATIVDSTPDNNTQIGTTTVR